MFLPGARFVPRKRFQPTRVREIGNSMTPNYVACGRRNRGESMRIAFEEVREGDIEGGGEVVVGGGK